MPLKASSRAKTCRTKSPAAVFRRTPRGVSLRVAGLQILLADVSSPSDPLFSRPHLGGFLGSEPTPPGIVLRRAASVRPSSQPTLQGYRTGSGTRTRVTLGQFYRVRVNPDSRRPISMEVRERATRLDVVLPHTTYSDILTAILVGLAQELPRRSGLLLHASAARFGNGVVVFPGGSGAGKSTAAHSFPPDQVIADERTAIRHSGQGWYAWSVPLLSEKYGMVKPADGPLKLIGIIQKNRSPSVRRIPSTDAVRALLGAVLCHHLDEASADRVLGVIVNLVRVIPVYQVACRAGDSVAELLHSSLGDGQLDR